MTITRYDKKKGKEISKEYAEVNQRVKAFRMVYPDGFIETQLLHDGEPFKDMTVCHMVAHVGYYLNGNRMVLGVGHAYEEKTTTLINQTSFIENCETSAVGRALGFAGFGIDTSVASYEEVKTAIQKQDEIEVMKKANESIPENKVIALMKRCEGEGVSIPKVAELYKVKDLHELTEKQYSHINLNWEEVKRRTK